MTRVDKFTFWFCFSWVVFWGVLLIESSLEQMGIGLNLTVRPEFFGTKTLQMMFPMFGIGVICLMVAGLMKLWYEQEKIRSTLRFLITNRIKELESAD